MRAKGEICSGRSSHRPDRPHILYATDRFWNRVLSKPRGKKQSQGTKVAKTTNKKRGHNHQDEPLLLYSVFTKKKQLVAAVVIYYSTHPSVCVDCRLCFTIFFFFPSQIAVLRSLFFGSYVYSSRKGVLISTSQLHIISPLYAKKKRPKDK